jgi:hypothetical protein
MYAISHKEDDEQSLKQLRLAYSFSAVGTL